MRYFGFVQPVPLFPIFLGAAERGLTALSVDKPLEGDWVRDDAHPLIRAAACQLEEYFAGRRQCFDVPLELEGTRFQKRVWEALTAIPYGETTSYGALAGALGNPRAVRAVGRANGANPVAIIVPCHRVIAADGTLCGYGGGLERKRFLLDLERRLTALPLS